MDDLDFGQKARSSAAMALDVLTRYLGGEPTADATAQARVAATTLSAYTRYYQAEGAREAARFGMAQASLSNSELAEYVRLAMPGHEVNQLTEPKKVSSAAR